MCCRDASDGCGWKDDRMRWERLFDDLEAQAAAEADLELAAEVADRTRRERAVLGLHERLAGMRRVGAVSAEVAGLGAVRIAPVGAVAKGFTVGAALRAISRDRAVVTIVDRDGQRRSGTIDAVGQDAVDLAEHPIDLPRRPEHVGDVRTIPFAWIGAVLRV